MVKWLRTHTKQIMVVVVLFAMFTFVGGSALTNMLYGSASGQVVMKVLGREIVQGELRSAQKETDALEMLLLPWRYDPEGGMNVRHWLMLAEEAEQTGIVIPDEQIDRQIAQSDEYRQQAGLGSLEDLRTTRRMSRTTIRRALSRHMAIQQYAARVVQAPPSEPQVRHYVQETQDKVQVKFVALDANRFVVPDEPVSDEIARKHFDRYRDVEAGDGEMGFGHRYPRRVKIQYIIAGVTKAQSEVEIGFDEIKNHWKVNRSKYKKTVYEDPPAPITSQPTSGPAATQPVEKPKPIAKQREMLFSEARDRIERELRKKKAVKVARVAVGKAADELAKPWNEVSVDKTTGYKPIPDGADDPDVLKRIAEKVGKQFGITLQFRELDLSSQERLSANPILGRAETPGVGDQPLSLAEYAFRVPAFHEVERERDADLRLQMFQPTSVPLTIAGRSFIFSGRQTTPTREPETFIVFRVVEARDAESPAGLEEVRTGVDRNIRLNRAYAAMEPAATEFFAAAGRLGVDAALNIFDDFRTQRGVRGVTTPPAFARWIRLSGGTSLRDALLAGEPTLTPSSVSGVGDSSEFVDACFEMASEVWATPTLSVPETEHTRAATTQPAASPVPKVRLLGIPKLKKWFIIEFVKSQPVNSDDFETQHRRSAYSTLLSERRFLLQTAWFDPKAIETRCAYENLLAGPTRDSSEGIDTPDAPEPIRF